MDRPLPLGHVDVFGDAARGEVLRSNERDHVIHVELTEAPIAGGAGRLGRDPLARPPWGDRPAELDLVDPVDDLDGGSDVAEELFAQQLLPRAESLANRIAMVPEASVRLNRAITLQGLLSSGLFNGHLLSGPLSTIVQASVGGPERKRLDEAFEKGGMRGFLDARDGPFLPEPGGPKSRVKAETPG